MKKLTFVAMTVAVAGLNLCREVPVAGETPSPSIVRTSTLQAPLPYRPKDGRTFSGPTRLILGWVPVDGSLAYLIEVSDSPSFETTTFTATTSGRSVVTSDFPAGSYYWRVSATQVNGMNSAWSSVQTFTILSGNIEW